MITNKKLLILLIIVFAFASSKGENLIVVTEEEQNKMLNEADDWIDDMPEGLQDKQSDAILHAIRGFNSELNRLRAPEASQSDPSEDITTTDIMGGRNKNIKMRLYERKNSLCSQDLPALIYFHGGLWSYGSIDTSDKFCKALVSDCDIKIISVAYPLSPENVYPTALNSCIEAIEYVFTNASELKIRKDCISVGGDDAGGNLALTSIVKMNENQNNLIPTKSLVLFYPLMKASVDKTIKAWRKYGKGYGLDSRLPAAAGNSYIKGLSGVETDYSSEDPFISPLLLKKEQLAKLPPMLMVAAGRDLLIDWEEEFNKVLKESSVEITFVNFNGAIHGFISDGHQPTALKKAAEITATFLMQK